MPYEVVFGREAVLPQDIWLGVAQRNNLQDVTTAEQYAEDAKFRLTNTFDTVLKHLHINRHRMIRKYNKGIRFRTFNVNDKVWFKLKHYKPGESRKL